MTAGSKGNLPGWTELVQTGTLHSADPVVMKRNNAMGQTHVTKSKQKWPVFTIIIHHQLDQNFHIHQNLHKHNFMFTISCQNQRHAKPKIIKDKTLSLKFNATLAERWKEPNNTSSASATTSTFASFFSDKNFSRTCKSSHWVISSCVKLHYYYLSCFTHSVASIR